MSGGRGRKRPIAYSIGLVIAASDGGICSVSVFSRAAHVGDTNFVRLEGQFMGWERNPSRLLQAGRIKQSRRINTTRSVQQMRS